jgi:2,4-dienoyl-CoA reductase-like NADH-dependent reductase (Old Yellow Enzyme family)
MTSDDLKRVRDDFVKSLRLAKTAGFDGIHLHYANGYLMDNFLRSFSNQRKDSYGGRYI